MKILSIEGENELTLYPNERGDGSIITQDEMRIFSSHCHKIYNPIVDKLCKKIIYHEDIKSDNIEIIIRYSSIPILQTFLDRLIRINKFIKLNGSDFAIEEYFSNEFKTPNSIGEFRKNIEKDFKFNNYVLLLISKLWKISKVRGVYNDELISETSRIKINNLSRIYSRNLINGLRFRISLFLSKIQKGKIPVFGLAYARAPLLKYGFYNKLFDDLDLKWPKSECIADDSLRSKIFTPDIFDCKELDEFYESQNIKLNSKEINKEICNFFKSFFPIESLELFEFNMNNARSVIKKYDSSFMIARGGATKGKFIIAAAKEKNMKIVGIQHGGYYGYINDNHQAEEFEYRDLDIFISWGWSRLPDHEFLKNVQIVKMPSPWLSERKKYWQSEQIKNKSQFEVLFMPSGVKRFPLSVRGAIGPRIDIIKDLSNEIKNTLDTLIMNNISILFKPYDDMTLKLLKNSLINLSSKYGDKYKIVETIDKGFSKELISSCGLILWNQPGTGFLECITAKIPTMILWTRISTQEEDWVKDIFNKLEQAGIIHSEVDSLMKEIKTFNKCPNDWINSPERIDVIEEFCHQFARVDDNWHKQWKNFFSNLN